MLPLNATKVDTYSDIASPECQVEKENNDLLTKSETLSTGVTVTFTSGTDTGNIIDSDHKTYSETANRTPNLTIGLGGRKAIDVLWLKGENLQGYTLKASNNNITYTDIQTGVTVADGRYSFLTFQNTDEYRYWRLAFSQRGASDPNYRVAEVFLIRLLLDLNTDEKRPLHYRSSTPRDGVAAYRNQNRKLNDPRYQQTNTSAYLSKTYANLAHGGRFLIFNPLSPPYQGDL